MPNFRHRLSRSQQREYDRSNRVGSIRLKVSPRLGRAVEVLREALDGADRPRTQRASQVICDEICSGLGVETLQVKVGGVRPSNRSSELYGLYTPGSDGKRDHVEVWMTTVKWRQVVAFKTFLRTLLHEICHHLDYAVLHLRESFHTDGFFKRESNLFHQVMGVVPQSGDARDASSEG